MQVRLLTLAIVLALAGCAGPSVNPGAAPALPQAAQAVSLIAPASFAFQDNGNPAGSQGSFVQSGGSAEAPLFKGDSPRMLANPTALQALWKTTAAVKKGDVLYGRFTMRALKARQESGEAEGLIYFVPLAGAMERASQGFSVGPDWVTVHFPFVAAQDLAPGEAALYLSFGNLEQSIEVKDVALVNYGHALAVADLPITRFSYAGREQDAAWRKAALARIETLRTAPLAVRVVDANGAPVAGARVQLAMTQPRFLWGSEINARRAVEESADAATYRAKTVELFDTAVIGDALKWPTWANPQGRAAALKTIDWLNGAGLRVKGHTLVWPAWKFSPPEIARDPARQAQIGSLVDAHIEDMLTATRGKLIGWDVINEPVHEQDYLKQVTPARYAGWYKTVAQSEPQLQLTLNEYAMLNRSTSPLFIREFKGFAEQLRREGARIDVLGVQGHVGQIPRAPVAVLSDLDLLAEGGNRIQITEFDVNTKDEALQGDYFRDFLIAVYSYPAVTGFIQWGFWEGQHWKPDAALYRKDWSEKPNGAVWRELVRGAWRTRAEGVSGADGVYAARGHHGRYRVEASFNGKQAAREVELDGSGAQLELRLPQ